MVALIDCLPDRSIDFYIDGADAKCTTNFCLCGVSIDIKLTGDHFERIQIIFIMTKNWHRSIKVSHLAFTFLKSEGCIDGCGTMIELELDGDAAGLSGVIISDAGGVEISFTYFEGGGGNDGPCCGDDMCDE